MDRSVELRQQLQQALAEQQPLQIIAGGSKSFFGREPEGELFDLTGHSGIVEYDFRELVVTVRAATPLLDLQQELARNGQYLPFEPPLFDETATIGGTLACGLSGAARPYRGSARDYLLGTQILNGKAEQLNFGGQVMKNVAGYDLSRLMVGAMGTLGIMLQLSLKVLPRPASNKTTVLQLQPAEAIDMMNRLAGQQYPLSASCYFEGHLYLRLSGFEASIDKSIQQIGGELMSDAGHFWQSWNNHKHAFFQAAEVLWRFSVPSTTAEISLPGKMAIDWGGAQRWLSSAEPLDTNDVFDAMEKVGGHATCYRGQSRQGRVMQPLAMPVLNLHKRLKNSLDPQAIFNPGRLYPDL